MKKVALIIFIIFSIPVYSQDIFFSDTSGTRGDVISLPLLIQDLSPDNSLELTFDINALMLNPIGLSFNENSLAADNSSNLDFIYNSDLPRESVISVDIFDFEDRTSDTLCFLDIEILAGPDTLATIELDSAIIDSESIDINSSITEIRIIEPVELIPDNIVGDVYPNPTTGEARANLYLNVPTTVTVSIYNISGKKVLKAICGDCEGELITIYDSEQMPVDKERILEPGEYSIKLVDQSNFMSAGAYVLIVSTDNQVLNKKFMIIK